MILIQLSAFNVKSDTLLLVSILLLLAATLSVVITYFPIEGGIAQFMKKFFCKEVINELILDELVDKVCSILVLWIKNIMKDSYNGSWIQAVLHFWLRRDGVGIPLKRSSSFLNPGFRICVTFVLLVAAFFSTFQKTPEIKYEQKNQAEIIDSPINSDELNKRSKESRNISRELDINEDGTLNDKTKAMKEEINYEKAIKASEIDLSVLESGWSLENIIGYANKTKKKNFNK